MPENANKSSLARILVPLVVALVGVMVIASLMRSPEDRKPAQGEDAPQQQADATPQADGKADGRKDADADTQDKPGAGDTRAEPIEPAVAQDPPDGPSDPDARATADADADTDADADAQADADAATDDFANLRPAFPDTPAALDEPDDLLTLGSLDPDAGYNIAARINPYRASIYDLSMVHAFHNVDRKKNYTLLNPISFDLGENNYPEAGTYAAKAITINGQTVTLARQDEATDQWFGHWQATKISDREVRLSLKIVAGPEDAPRDIATITRTYTVRKADQPGSHTVSLTQRVKNLTDQPMTIQWEQLAQGGVYHATNDYLQGRSNQYITAYFDLKYDQARFAIHVRDQNFLPEPELISKLKDPGPDKKWQSIWPNPNIDRPETKELAWLASENRYFVAIASAPTLAKPTQEPKDVTPLQAIYPTITTSIYPNQRQAPNLDDTQRKVILGLVSKEITLQPEGTSANNDLSLDLFAGPREADLFAQQPYKALQFDKTIRYSLGGICGFCTFQWLANLLLGFLDVLHGGLWIIPGLADWGVAIVILVLVVRLILHPLTKRGQTNMMKMGKQMAAIQPDLNKLKKKYADDPRQMQQAQMQLFREKGINPAAGALGCLPMFLQMPIWIALYAMLYYAIELRHETAFYGVFQMFGGWAFLADLSSADRFISLLPDDGTHVLSLIFIRLDYSSINLLPILMGVTFYFNMKFTTPPPMNEQQATQQKIMKIMPLLFPFFLYSAPAGLTLYICASTLAGIVDSYIVRKHVKEMEESGELFKPKERKPGGMMDKLQKAAEAQAAKAEELKKQQQQAKNKGTQSNYKKRKR